MSPVITAKLFKNGNSQAVRLPKEFRFEGEEVLIHREGERIVLQPKKRGWDAFFESDKRVCPDFMSARGDRPPQERELF